MGSNAGLYLKMATEKGFRNIIGIEKSRRACRVAEKYRDSLGLNYKIINKTINGDFNFNDLPVADITLMANFHYHLFMHDLVILLDRLRYKTCYCLVVSAQAKKAHWRPGAEINDIRLFFKEWEEVGAVYNVSSKGDPHPRPMWSLLFNSPLRRKLIKDIYNPKQLNGIDSHSTIDLACKVRDNDSIKDIKKLPYFDRVYKFRVGDWSEDKMICFIQGKINLMYDVKNNGLKNPILVRLDNRIIEGGHRLIMMKELGYKSIITRTV